MVNFQEQELPLRLCIIAIMQREELSDSRNNRQAAETKGAQNEGQIWQRAGARSPAPAQRTANAQAAAAPSAQCPAPSAKLVAVICCSA
jgi:hypothetical protein